MNHFNAPIILCMLYTTRVLATGLHVVPESEYWEKLAQAVQCRSVHTHTHARTHYQPAGYLDPKDNTRVKLFTPKTFN